MAEPETAAPPTPEPPKKKSKMTLVVVALAVLLLGAGGFFAFKFLYGSKSQSQKSASENPTEKIKSMMNLEPFLVNLADPDATRFVKVTFRLGLDQAKLGEEYASDPVILTATRDRILTLLSQKTSDDILSAEGKQKLREEILKKINPILPKGRIVEVFIMDFVVQL